MLDSLSLKLMSDMRSGQGPTQEANLFTAYKVLSLKVEAKKLLQKVTDSWDKLGGEAMGAAMYDALQGEAREATKRLFEKSDYGKLNSKDRMKLVQETEKVLEYLKTEVLLHFWLRGPYLCQFWSTWQVIWFYLVSAMFHEFATTTFRFPRPRRKLAVSWRRKN